jgi:tetratricopeptide (TPR) repeat protein
MNLRLLSGLSVFLVLLVGCAATPESADSEVVFQDAESLKPRIEPVDDVDPVNIPDVEPVQVRSVSHSSVVKSYQRALKLISDPAIKARIERRLAGLAMVESEELQVQGETFEQQKLAMSKFDSTIEAYKRLLKDYPNHPDNDKVYYQLAKAYGLKGHLEASDKLLETLLERYPNSVLASEAYYRRAEFFYSNKKYPQAGVAYEEVIKRNDNPKTVINARYMLAWSLFKQSDYEASLDEFTHLLDELAPSKEVYQSLTKTQKALIEDAFRAMSYAFSYQEGGKSVVQYFEKVGARHYESLVFSSLGLLYQSKERYQDAADVYLAYVKRHPLAADSPDVYARVIKVYELGRFPSVIIPAKAEYATKYGFSSAWYAAQKETIAPTHIQRLKDYTGQLASYFHTRGQKSKKGTKEQTDHFNAAIVWYNTYIQNFPNESDVPQKYHRSGDVYTLLGDPANASQAYLKAAYDYPEYDIQSRSSAGYAAVVAFQGIAEKSKLEKDVRIKIEQSLKYADVFGNDSRSIGILVDASESLLKLDEYQPAREIARKVIVKLLETGKSEYAVDQSWNTLKWQPYSSRKHRRAAWVVVGHASFELADYPQAENGYFQSLRLMKKNHELYPSLRQRLAISIYRQGEALAKENKNQEALNHFERVLVVVPEADIKVQTQYDITAQHLILKQWSPAISKLKAFRKTYPKHKLSNGIQEKLIYAYEQSERWPEAANELTAMANNEALDQEQRRKALYQAASYYEKGGDIPKAIDRYRTYAHGYPQPFIVNLETQHKLAELYKARKETNKRKYWLKKIIANDKSAGSNRTERSIYLAAAASYELADDHWRAFTSTKLTLPLGKSIKRKQKAMQRVIKEYTAIADYGVSEFSTASTHRIADAYYRMSKDLMNSERPKGLDELELEQYDILLEEQAYPFEETSIEVYETNVARTVDGVYDDWVKESFKKLATIMPARYAKDEQVEGYADVLQ